MYRYGYCGFVLTKSTVEGEGTGYGYWISEVRIYI